MKTRKKLTSNQRWNNFIAVLTLGTAFVCIAFSVAVLYLN
jgi:hypothetical protein